jgi:predicted metal-dependent phosphoesterase TrpH
METLKACLHLHVKGDARHSMRYSAIEAILSTKQKGFDVVALTCHDKFVYNEEIAEFGVQNGITVIPGIEKRIEKKHVIILNADIEAEKINNFKELKAYKSTHKNTFILAPHPYHLAPSCLMNKLITHIDLFDGIEWSFFYSPLINPNRKAEITAKKYNKPLIGTADVHYLDGLEYTYSLIESKSNSVTDITDALRQNKVKIITTPLSTFGLIKVIIRQFIETH